MTFNEDRSGSAIIEVYKSFKVDLKRFLSVIQFSNLGKLNKFPDEFNNLK